ncbi:type I restriction enzyme HsdR N-terminal domain-containing protein [Bacteroidales bacterium OttesenSCG-928-B11]|nr:type I restriction enzyme HsdR N-terminal domain-containing protein [Bacteroidales bacterium OttesenSCG-928-B11]
MLKYRNNLDKKEIYDPIRRKWVKCTEEEEVRQCFILYLLQKKQIPATHIAVEKEIKVNGLSKRYDLIVFNRNGDPYLVIECKAPHVEISQSVVEQVAVYNKTLRAPLIGVTNGKSHYFFHINFENNEISYCDFMG